MNTAGEKKRSTEGRAETALDWTDNSTLTHHRRQALRDRRLSSREHQANQTDERRRTAPFEAMPYVLSQEKHRRLERYEIKRQRKVTEGQEKKVLLYSLCIWREKQLPFIVAS